MGETTQRKHITTRQISELLEQDKKHGLREALQEFLRTQGPRNSKASNAEQAFETITVPDLPAEALLAVVKEQASLTFLHPDYQIYAFIQDERGKTFEVATWEPGQSVSSETVREHFRTLGFTGNAAAFISWVAKNHPERGWYLTIPEDECCFSKKNGLFFPAFGRGGLNCDLNLFSPEYGWHDGYCFVAFREIKG